MRSAVHRDARELGIIAGRTHRELTDDDITRIADIYHRWRAEADGHEDQPGFCRRAELEEATMCSRPAATGAGLPRTTTGSRAPKRCNAPL